MAAPAPAFALLSPVVTGGRELGAILLFAGMVYLVLSLPYLFYFGLAAWAARRWLKSPPGIGRGFLLALAHALVAFPPAMALGALIFYYWGRPAAGDEALMPVVVLGSIGSVVLTAWLIAAPLTRWLYGLTIGRAALFNTLLWLPPVLVMFLMSAGPWAYDLWSRLAG